MWTISNLISLGRLLLVIPMMFTMIAGYQLATLGIFALAYLSDLADGWLARRMNQISEFGKIIDPLADKVFVGVAALIITVLGQLPIWFVSLVLARDIVIFGLGIYASKKLGYVLPSNYTGKVTVVMIGISLMLGYFSIDVVLVPFLILTSIAMAASMLVYWKRYRDVLS